MTRMPDKKRGQFWYDPDETAIRREGWEDNHYSAYDEWRDTKDRWAKEYQQEEELIRTSPHITIDMIKALQNVFARDNTSQQKKAREERQQHLTNLLNWTGPDEFEPADVIYNYRKNQIDAGMSPYERQIESGDEYWRYPKFGGDAETLWDQGIQNYTMLGMQAPALDMLDARTLLPSEYEALQAKQEFDTNRRVALNDRRKVNIVKQLRPDMKDALLEVLFDWFKYDPEDSASQSEEDDQSHLPYYQRNPKEGT